MKLVIGCPLYERAWALPAWFASVAAQELGDPEKGEVRMAFVITHGKDGTDELVRGLCKDYGYLYSISYTDQTTGSIARAAARPVETRFKEFVPLRNELLRLVRTVGPDYFLSWDSDIIFGRRVLQNLWHPDARNRNGIWAYPEEKAVGALVDMAGGDGDRDKKYWSFMNFTGEEYPSARRNVGGLDNELVPHYEKAFQADAIMAVKLMGRRVYEEVEYKYDPVGEDIGWSHNVAEAGFERWVQPAARGYHLIYPPNKEYMGLIEELLR